MDKNKNTDAFLDSVKEIFVEHSVTVGMKGEIPDISCKIDPDFKDIPGYKEFINPAYGKIIGKAEDWLIEAGISDMPIGFYLPLIQVLIRNYASSLISNAMDSDDPYENGSLSIMKHCMKDIAKVGGSSHALLSQLVASVWGAWACQGGDPEDYIKRVYTPYRSPENKRIMELFDNIRVGDYSNVPKSTVQELRDMFKENENASIVIDALEDLNDVNNPEDLARVVNKANARLKEKGYEPLND